MNPPTAAGLVTLAGETLRRLSGAAESTAGVEALRDAGHAGGAALYSAFSESVRAGGRGDPSEMPLDEFSSRASAFFAEAGWGSVTLRSSHDALAVIDIEKCWEAETGGGRGCHVTTGVLAGFLSPLADYPLAVMEVESPPRSRMRTRKCDARYRAGRPRKNSRRSSLRRAATRKS